MNNHVGDSALFAHKNTRISKRINEEKDENGLSSCRQNAGLVHYPNKSNVFRENTCPLSEMKNLSPAANKLDLDLGYIENVLTDNNSQQT